MQRRTTLLIACALALPLLPAQADSLADRPITLVVPFPPGGPTDAMARTLAASMKDRLGQTMVVENRAGAGGNIGAEYVARAAADGQTLLFGTSGPLAINASLYRKIGYDPVKSFAPVIQVGHLPNILVVHPAVPVHNVKELLAYAKAHPGRLSYASSGNGASSHLAGVLFNASAGVQLQHIPYKGTGPALNDLLGGQVSMSFTDVLTAAPYVKAGRLRALGIATAARSQVLPDLPSIAEQGLAGYDVSVFFGIVAPAQTPPERVRQLNRAFAQVLAAPEVRQKFAAQGLEPAPASTPEQLGQFIPAQMALWSAVVRQSGAQLD
ncbi:Bug family tripartite tricarboxylate transporter substrate binding protein [Verminephrobacter eiseniae]|uniref:Bug family tripartite tricarboxylate transporter substrate binding protein n=1 Tax=Verminephrobacter eiseniae TaxID=364317 RepID=UPI00223787B1|nr:tripartite tricarboxylate transporter substrate binding protein [Verminephrobacter eiseniae]MCW5234675.1 tripartite tricarboxylate transporter substrate binding protein [Verminephrobacter eiseniae]MCW5293750.1 tripartite tricarboxylate transporter substrate binding protein [Verminephrobacter eiseniae]MCW8183541.1 tripartite tricarboxylate transporter substrate binding protein [Verminephrobacter eiseniae]MCW8221875.1 tripartite tricarboxylate transporter substrate binding protein [Verminephro